MHVLGFHHLAIQVRDLDRTVAFYRKVLGLEELTRHFHPNGTIRAIWLSVGGPGGFLAFETVEGHPAPDPFRHDRPGLLMIALRIAAADRERVLDELAKHEVRIEHQTAWTVYFRDPEGNRVALSHYPDHGQSC